MKTYIGLGEAEALGVNERNSTILSDMVVDVKGDDVYILEMSRRELTAIRKLLADAYGEIPINNKLRIMLKEVTDILWQGIM